MKLILDWRERRNIKWWLFITMVLLMVLNVVLIRHEKSGGAALAFVFMAALISWMFNIFAALAASASLAVAGAKYYGTYTWCTISLIISVLAFREFDLPYPAMIYCTSCWPVFLYSVALMIITAAGFYGSQRWESVKPEDLLD